MNRKGTYLNVFISSLDVKMISLDTTLHRRISFGISSDISRSNISSTSQSADLQISLPVSASRMFIDNLEE